MTLKCSESFVLTEPQNIVIFWIFLELSFLSQNDLKHRNKPSEAVGFPAELGHLSNPEH